MQVVRGRRPPGGAAWQIRKFIVEEIVNERASERGTTSSFWH
jgi:hypothetical protein